MVETATLLAQEKTRSGRLSFEHIETIAKLELADSSLDGILCSSVLEYMPDPNACLAEFARVLRLGGRLLVSVPNRNSVVRRSQTAWHKIGGWLGQTWVPYLKYSCNQYSVDEFKGALITHGFSVGKIVPFGVPLPLRLRRRRFLQSLLMFTAKRIEFSGPTEPKDI
jgi:2-polyprenyl-6-hydroxyphenyl methylase/3-demethylubiquinone-9 3-methyltransferase